VRGCYVIVVNNLKRAKHLITIPGISYYAALLISTEIADINRFPHYEHLLTLSLPDYEHLLTLSLPDYEHLLTLSLPDYVYIHMLDAVT
jgi:hypothetical protein